ncbi:MAG: hypothetical protein JXR95_13045 [Deltaproteobacteria bacterium]|nr:hypothetical protein [Deltaproteobacteria bacterium]
MKKLIVLTILVSLFSCNSASKKKKTTALYRLQKTPWGRVDFYTTTRKTTDIEVTPSEVWVGTNKGLEHFNKDGGGYYAITAKDGLPGNRIISLATEKNLLWVATEKGLAQYNQGAWQNKVLPVKGKITVLKSNSGGGLWVGTDNGLVFMAFGRSVVYLKGSKINTMDIVSGGVYVGTENDGVYSCMEGSCKQFDAHLKQINSICHQGKNMWVSGVEKGGRNVVTSIIDKKFYYYEVPSKVQWIQFFKGIPLMYSENGLFNIYPCSRGGNGEKLSRFESTSPCFKLVRVKTKFPPKMTIVKLYEQFLWFGTESMGAAKWDGDYFSYYSSKNLVNRRSTNLALSCDETGKKCYFTAGRESFIYYGNKKGFISVDVNKPGWEFIYFLDDPLGRLMGIAKNDTGGLAFFMKNPEGNWIQRGNTLALETGEKKIYVNFAFFTKKNYAWVGIGKGKKAIGVYVFNFRKNKIYPPKNYHDINGRKVTIPASVRRMSKMYSHRYLASTEGIVHLWRISGKKYLEKKGETDGLNSDVINDVVIDKNGGLWAATDLGLCHQSKGRPWRCGERSVLPDAGAISSFAYDEKNDIIYVSAQTELYRIKKGKVDGKLVGIGNLLNENSGDIRLDNEGKLWVMHRDGISILHLN